MKAKTITITTILKEKKRKTIITLIKIKMRNEHETYPFYANFEGLHEGFIAMCRFQPNPKFSW